MHDDQNFIRHFSSMQHIFSLIVLSCFKISFEVYVSSFEAKEKTFMKNCSDIALHKYLDKVRLSFLLVKLLN